jgi:hypothetical protein
MKITAYAGVLELSSPIAAPFRDQGKALPLVERREVV